MYDLYQYKAKVEKIVDGDTFDLLLDLGLGITALERVRLKTVDTYEKYGVKKNTEEYQKGIEATAFVHKYIPEGSTVYVKTFKNRSGREMKGARGRYLADVMLEIDGAFVSLSDLLQEAGHVKKTY